MCGTLILLHAENIILIIHQEPPGLDGDNSEPDPLSP